MAFPFLFIALSLAGGIFLGSFLSFPFFSWLLIMLSCLLVAWVLFFIFQKLTPTFIFILLTTAALGASIFTYENKIFEENTLYQLDSSDYIDFYGTLSKSPAKGMDRIYVFLRVQKIRSYDKEEKVNGNLRITIPESKEASSILNLYTGDKIKVSAKLTPLKNFQNFNTSNTSMMLKSQKLHQRAFSKSPLLVERLKTGNKYSFFRIISILRKNLQEKIEKFFPNQNAPQHISQEGAVLEALLLGERRRMEDSLTRSFQEAGLYHLFAISGAHIAILSFLMYSFFKVLSFPTRLSYLLMIFILVFYAFLVEGRPSVLRATIMTLAFLFGKLLWKDVSLLNTLGVSAFFLLLVNPFDLFTMGFQLTFAATLSIILFFPKVINFLPRLPLKISEIFALSLTAQLGVLPIVAFAFNRITFSSILLNYAALPLVGLIMGFGYIFLALSFMSSFLSQILATCLKSGIHCLITISQVCPYQSFLSYRIPTPHLLTVLAYFVFLLALLIRWKARKVRWLFLVCFTIVFIILITFPFVSNSKTLKITFIDVGQGESILVEFPGRTKMLIDGGGLHNSTFDIGERVVSQFLWQKGIKALDYLVLTHAHPDHLNGLISIAKNFKIKNYWESCSPWENSTYAEFRKSLSNEIRCHKVFRGDSRRIGEITIDAFHPPRGNICDTPVNNDHSLVLRFSYGETAFLLTGDITIQSEEDILNTTSMKKCQVLKSPHHGSKSSSSMAFLKQVFPQIIIISVGKGNSYELPSQEVLERYHEINARVYRTDIHGAVEVSSDGHQISVRTSSSISP
ncbi:MAG: DNA internalization-related competence protein ComEC/Rec2 [Acidobacteriota bacterium]|nr:DNA internalization-related competence protein ComEC/Rec2 [Acidobacteriota bacterium]